MLYETVHQQISAIAAYDNISTFISNYSGLYRIQSLIAILRGLTFLPEVPASYVEFYCQMIPLLPRLFKLVRLHDELCLQVIKTVLNFSQIVVKLMSVLLIVDVLTS